MKIIMYAINPLYPDHVIGGAPKHLHNIAVHLGEKGHEVRVLCTWSKEAPEAFTWHDNVTVLPQLRFSLPFPQPYDIPAYQFAEAVEFVGRELQDADRFYMHDGEFLFPRVSQHIPTVVSLRDNVYPETMLGAFNFHGDDLICISEYSGAYYKATAGRFYPGFDERLHIVNNGLDWERFSPGEPSADIIDLVGINPLEHAIMLHPHRPEPSKGLARTIAVADRLVHQHGVPDLRVLVPEWGGSSASAEVGAYYDAMMREINERGLVEHFIFHPWVPQSMMHDYYRLGDVLLALGYFQEAFGNVPYEALGCGTPAIVARVSTHRSIMPEGLIDKVHYGDDDEAAAVAAEIIRTKRRTSDETLAYLATHYGVEQQLAAYEHIITGARIKGPLAYVPFSRTPETRYALAPWCYCRGDSVFNDHMAAFSSEPQLVRLVAGEGSFVVDEAHSTDEVERWYSAGFIVPVPPTS